MFKRRVVSEEVVAGTAEPKRWEKEETVPNDTLSVTARNDFCIKMGSDVSHFNVLLIVRDKVAKFSTEQL